MANPLHEDEQNFLALIDWVHWHGGRVDPRLGLETFDGVRGVVALDDISQGDLLLHCPWQLVIGSSRVGQTVTPCEIVMSLRKELERAEHSPWRPYLSVFNGIDNRIPNLWSQVILDELQGLPPYDVRRHTDWFTQCCIADGSRKGLCMFDELALVSYVTRANDLGMVPFYDLLNHHNGELNIKTHVTNHGAEVVARTSIDVGSQIYNTYGVRPTTDLFRDYGFVEPWPRNWAWTDEEKQTHSFMQLPGDFIAIEPTPEFCTDLFNRRALLGEYQERARNHTRGSLQEVLSRFEKAAKKLLNSLPTGPSEDARILAQFCNQKRNNRNAKSQGDTQQKDMIDCVRYRMEFKRAILSALNAISTT